MNTPIAYFITFTTYGTWLHGRDSGSVDLLHNQYGMPGLSSDPEREAAARSRMRQPAYYLDEPRRHVVLNTILDVAQHRGWRLWAAHVRSNHVHIVVTAELVTPERVMADFKAWASRRLREFIGEESQNGWENIHRERWTHHGSTKYLWTEDSLALAVSYVVEHQGEAMAVYNSRGFGEIQPEPGA